MLPQTMMNCRWGLTWNQPGVNSFNNIWNLLEIEMETSFQIQKFLSFPQVLMRLHYALNSECEYSGRGVIRMKECIILKSSQ